MKKILLSGFFLLAFNYLSSAQCVVKNVIIKVNSSVPSGTGCMMNFDFVFTIENNGGNKYIYLHSWLTNEYPNYFNCPGVSNNAKAPVLSDLLLSRINLGIHNDIHAGHPAPTLMTTYIPDPNVTITPASGLTRQVYPSGDSARFTIKGIDLYVPFACNSVVGMTADVWSSQAQSATQIHCISCNNQFVIDPKVTGLINCTDPRTCNLIIRSVAPTTISGNYQLYIDNPSDPNQSGTTGTFGPEDVLATTGNYATQLKNGFNEFVTTNLPYEPFSYTKPAADRNLWVLVETEGYTNKAMGYLLNSCAPLQIMINDFNGKYHNGKVQLNWTLESDEQVFSVEVQRKYEGESFKVIASPENLVQENNGSDQVNKNFYQYEDLTYRTGAHVYYRLKVTGSNNVYYSDVITVKTGMVNRIMIYPNPSDGHFQVSLPENSMGVDLIITDISGRRLKSWMAVQQRRIDVSDLMPGVYFLQVRMNGGGEVITEQIVIR